MNALIEMTKLFYDRPAPGAPDETVAAWYRAKGRMHEWLAATGGPDAGQERGYAQASYEHAHRLALRAVPAGSAAIPTRRAA